VDFTVAGSVLGALLLAIPAIGAFFERRNRAQRRENRKLRALVQEYDMHCYTLERKGWTSRGVRPPPRPELLRALSADEDTNEDEATLARPPRPDGEAAGGPRHAAS
jgi:hypothetical protein